MAVIDKIDKQCMSGGAKAFVCFLLKHVLKDKILYRLYFYKLYLDSLYKFLYTLSIIFNKTQD